MMIIAFPAALTAASILGLILITLSFLCVRERFRKKIEIGDGDNPTMQRLIRAQANFTEYVPLALIIIALLEANQAPTILTYGLATLLVVGRILHPLGFIRKKGRTFGRFFGTLATLLTILIGCFYGLFQVLGL